MITKHTYSAWVWETKATQVWRHWSKKNLYNHAVSVLSTTRSTLKTDCRLKGSRWYSNSWMILYAMHRLTAVWFSVRRFMPPNLASSLMADIASWSLLSRTIFHKAYTQNIHTWRMRELWIMMNCHRNPRLLSQKGSSVDESVCIKGVQKRGVWVNCQPTSNNRAFTGLMWSIRNSGLRLSTQSSRVRSPCQRQGKQIIITQWSSVFHGSTKYIASIGNSLKSFLRQRRQAIQCTSTAIKYTLWLYVCPYRTIQICILLSQHVHEDALQ